MNWNYIFYPMLILTMLWLLYGKGGLLVEKKAVQRTWCFCPACKVDLCSNDSLIYDGNEFSNHVVYKCKEKGCGNVSFWDFDIAPIPILISSDEGSTDMREATPKATESPSAAAADA